jgi:TRAP-type mannitol/chloroaromatic compound transport system substrate-binding protein
MKRRKFLASTGAVAGVAVAFPKPAITQGVRELKLVTSWPKGLPGLGTGAERVARSITALSGGRLQVNVFAAGEFVGAFESFDAVAAGVADMYHSGDYYWQSYSPAFSFFCAGTVRADRQRDELLDLLGWRPGAVGYVGR